MPPPHVQNVTKMSSKVQNGPTVLSEAKITERFSASGCLCALDPATDIEVGKKVLTFDNGLVHYSETQDWAKISAEEKRRKGCIAQHIARFCSAPDGVSMPEEKVLVLGSEDIWWVSGQAEASISNFINLGCCKACFGVCGACCSCRLPIAHATTRDGEAPLFIKMKNGCKTEPEHKIWLNRDDLLEASRLMMKR